MSGTAPVGGAPSTEQQRPDRPGEGLRTRVGRLPLLGHVCLLIALFAVVAPFMELDETYTSDEGAYAIQVRDLRDGHWAHRYAARTVDPAGRWFPLANSTATDDRYFAYVQHPAYPVLLLAATRVVGLVAGLHLLAIMGAVALAAAAWLLAAEVDDGPWPPRAAFWLAASGPVALHAYILWAHALSAAVAGFTLLAAIRLLRGVRALPLAGLTAGVAAGVLLRSEGLLFALALAGGLLLVGLRGRPMWHRVGIPALCAAVAVAVTSVEQRWIRSIIGQSAGFRGARDTVGAPGVDAPASSFGSADWAKGRVEGAFHTLFSGGYEQARSVTVLVALALLGYAARAHRRRRAGWERDVAFGLAASAVAYAGVAVTGPPEAMTGLLAAWPLALLGLASLQHLGSAAARLMLAVTVFLLGAVLATQYRIGGGLEWGGRFLAPAYAAAAVLASVGLRRLVASLPSRPDSRRRVVVGAMSLLAVVPLWLGLVLLHDTRSDLGRLLDELTTGEPQLVLTDSVALPRAAWRTYGELDWMLVPGPDLVEATERLRAGGFRRVTLLVAASVAPEDLEAFPAVEDVTGPAARRLGRRTLELTSP